MPGKARRAFPVITAAVAIPVAFLIAAGASARPTGPESTGWQPQIVAAAPDAPGTAATASRYVISPSLAQSEAAMRGQLVADRSMTRALPPGVADERGLQVRTILAERAISERFRDITRIGGVRADSMRWHPNGLAIDVMIPDYTTAAGKELGDRVVAFAFQNAERFGLEHVIWQQTYYPASGRPQFMADLGNDDANHYTHVHIATTGGGYPSGAESYLR